MLVCLSQCYSMDKAKTVSLGLSEWTSNKANAVSLGLDVMVCLAI